LREGVTFHNGADFTADDVLFSYERASGETSDVRSWFASVTDVKVVDDYTIDFMTSAPNPIFPGSIANFMIMDRDWAVEQCAETPATDEERYTTLNTNGTAAFRWFSARQACAPCLSRSRIGGARSSTISPKRFIRPSSRMRRCLPR
jgi:peptide/nickel transport system substrate-binding protein